MQATQNIYFKVEYIGWREMRQEIDYVSKQKCYIQNANIAGCTDINII